MAAAEAARPRARRVHATMGTRALAPTLGPAPRREGTPLSKWSDILGFGGKDRNERISSDDARKAARIRETMRWRGYDLTPYTDAEIVAVSERLGGGVSDTGETTEASREALQAALQQMRSSGEVIERAPREQAPPPRPEAPTPPEAVEEAAETVSPIAREPEPPVEKVVESPVAAPPPVRRAPSRDEADDRTFLVRFRHVFGSHSWRPVSGPEGVYLWCPGCREERALPAGPQPLSFSRDDDVDDAPPFEPAETPEPKVQDEWRIPPLSEDATQPQPQPEPLPGLVRWVLRSPWWMKMIAIFAIVQVAGAIASLVRGI